MLQTLKQVLRRIKMSNKIKLISCAPDSLLSNIKALGIFRIIAEQADFTVKAYWDNNDFVLQTNMTKDDLLTFFLEKYIPTPIVSPWNNGSGFYKSGAELVDVILNSKDSRIKEYQSVIKKTKEIILTVIPAYRNFHKELKNLEDKKEKEHDKKRKKMVDNEIKEHVKGMKKIIEEKKNEILQQCRNMSDDKIIPWLDAVYVTTNKDPSFGAVLGTGGNDGNFEISLNFMKWVSELLIKNESKRSVYARRDSLLRNSLFDEYADLENSSIAYFHPGMYTGPAVSGVNTKYSVMNPWDFIFTIEGTMLFAGSISRRSNSRRAAFPFTTPSSTAGYSTACDEKTRDEIWIPLWGNPTTYGEIKHVFNEGRSQINSKNVSSGVDFARSVVSMGTERGISTFHRFGMFERKGQAFFAINLGAISTNTKPEANLLTEIDSWLDRIKKLQNLPESMDSLLRKMNNSIIDFCTYGTPFHLQQILIIIGKIEHHISHSSLIRDDVDPIRPLSYKWLQKCYDGSPEYRLAVSLAAIHSEDNKIRQNLEPVKLEKNWMWKEKSPSCVWKNTGLVNNMIEILRRRCIESQMNQKQIQLYSSIYAPLKDVMQFINGDINYNKIADLLLPLSTITHNGVNPPDYNNQRELWELPELIPEQYIILKSNFPPTKHSIENTNLLFEPNVLELLKSNKHGNAINIMRRRLFVSGHPISTYSNGQTSIHISQKYLASQLIASLLFPIRDSDMKKILANIYTRKVNV